MPAWKWRMRAAVSRKGYREDLRPVFLQQVHRPGPGPAVVLGIVRAHHGAVTVESKPDRGSIFRVFFPVSAEEVPHQPDKAVQTPEMEGGGTVLVVEDEEQVRNMAKIMLTRLGFTVLEAKGWHRGCGGVPAAQG